MAFPLGDASIPEGWNEALDGRSVGDELRIVLPPGLGPDPASDETSVSQVTIVSNDPFDG